MLLIVGVATSCVSRAPKPPVVEFYLNDVPAGVAYCSSSNGVMCAPVRLSDTDGWYSLKPEGVQAIQDYVDTLVCIIDGGCQSQQEYGIESASKKDLRAYAERFKDLRDNLEWQKSQQ